MENEKPNTELEKVTPQTSVEKLQEILDTLDTDFSNPSIIQDNKFIFKLGDYLYRSRMPNQKERSEAEAIKDKLYGRLLQEGGYLTRKQLIKLLLKQDIDVIDLQDKKIKLEDKLKDNYLELAMAVTGDDVVINKLKADITEIENKHMLLSLEISNFLSPSIEDRLEKDYIEYLTAICTEKLTGKDDWSPAYTSFEEFQKGDTKLENKAVEAMAHLLVHIKD